MIITFPAGVTRSLSIILIMSVLAPNDAEPCGASVIIVTQTLITRHVTGAPTASTTSAASVVHATVMAEHLMTIMMTMNMTMTMNMIMTTMKGNTGAQLVGTMMVATDTRMVATGSRMVMGTEPLMMVVTEQAQMMLITIIIMTAMSGNIWKDTKRDIVTLIANLPVKSVRVPAKSK